jgi:hypothetical protein
MQDVVEGDCACGTTRYRLTAPPMFVNCCHCRSCQAETGSAFVVNALIEAAHVVLPGAAPEAVATPSESGHGQTIWRCPTCRVALFSHYGMAPAAMRFVRVGTLDRPADCPPMAHVYTRSKLPWVAIPADLPAFDTFSPLATHWPAESVARWKAAAGG